MTYQNGPPSQQIANAQALLRSPSTKDLPSLAPELLSGSRGSKRNYSVSFASAAESECRSSENSQVLYMTDSPKRIRKSRASLSSIGNRSSHRMTGSLDADMEKESESDDIAWNIIDREIFEWQYVCRTGQPYWWPPESKYNSLKELPCRITKETSRSAIREVDERYRNCYSTKRRAISDSYLAGQDFVEDLVHLVAIQLLGSCFTLPPDHNRMLLPDYTSYDQTGAENSPDPLLISALKMHTHFRYSPCFGHQARNTSPIQLWAGPYDGPSPASSPPVLANGFQSPITGSSGSLLRRNKSHRPLKVTEGSENDYLWGNRSDDYLNSPVKHHLHSEAPTTSHRRKDTGDDKAHRPVLPHMPSVSTRKRQRPTTGYGLPMDGDVGIPESYRGVQRGSRSPKTNYRLQPVIRSEPHHVFVQPVKELVVKRWKTFRRRFGGSLHAPLPSGSEGDMSVDSTSPSGASSPAMSSDGRSRRRRAQERGDIHSAGVSVDSTPHYNSPASGYLSPNGSGQPYQFWVDSVNPSPAFQLADPLAAAAALALVQTHTSSVQTSISTSTPPSTSHESSSSLQVHPQNSTDGDHSTPEIGGRREPKSGSNSSYRRIQKRAHRKSMLSEMHTPEDFAENTGSSDSPREPADRNVLSVAGSTLSSPIEEPEPDVDLVIRLGARESIGNLGPMGVFPTRRMTVAGSRPRLTRRSTSGTQVFTPSDEGVEIDGLPVGPGRETWHGMRRERTYL